MQVSIVSTMMRAAALVLALAACGAPTADALAAAGGRGGGSLRTLVGGDGPVTKVVKLLEEMKKRVQAETQEDEDIYGKMACWCETNSKERSEAIEVAQKRLVELSATIEEGEARGAQLTAEIGTLKEGIKADEEALGEATEVYQKEKSAFVETEKEYMEASSTLKGAIAVLSKVQPGNEEQALMQVRSLAAKVGGAAAHGPMLGTMQRDLWDFLGSLPSAAESPTRVITGLEQQPMEGHAAGAKSYNQRSTRIFGLLSQMKRNFDENLAESQRAHVEAEVNYQRLRAAKEGEIESANRALESKTTALAETNQAVAQAKEDTETTTNALDADQRFLLDLEKRCKVANDDYDTRSKTRQDEIVAISEAQAILMKDGARDLFSKTVSFVQLGSQSRSIAASRSAPHGALLQTQASQQGRASAASKLLALARAHSSTDGGRHLAMLAVAAQFDGIDTVKKLMGDMVQQLKGQQKDEYGKKEACVKSIHSNEGDTRAKQSEARELDAKHTGLEGQLQATDEELAELSAEIGQAHVALKAAGEGRKAENLEFQQVVADQRATAEILKKALKRLQAFYDEAFVELGKRASGHRQAPPAAGLDHSKSSGATGVLQILEKILQDVEKADHEAVQAEQDSQESYSELVANINSMLQASQAAVSQKRAERETTDADLLNTKQDLETNGVAIEEFGRQNRDLHMSCDYLINNFDVRQNARQEEIDAINQALSILSGADFGN